jgi:hypothetical protein
MREHVLMWNDEGDFVVYGYWYAESHWVEKGRWLIPGTQLED